MKPLITAPTSDLTELIQAARQLGFDKLLYTVESMHPPAPYPLRIVSNAGKEIVELWLRHIEQDPLRRMVASGELPFPNLPIVFENRGRSLSPLHRSLTAGEISLLESCLAHGVRSGVSMAMRMAHGFYASVNFYSLHATDPQQQRSLVEKLFLIGHEIQTRLEGTLPCLALSSDYPKLSAREQECLRWMSQGKQTEQIAAILGISRETVRDHAKAILRKLATTNRAQAVARAYT
jgi:DNA-binding CsgD family transcriptional regulator